MYIYIYIYTLYIYIYIYISPSLSPVCRAGTSAGRPFSRSQRRPNLPLEIVPAKICRLDISENFPMGPRIPTLRLKTLLASNPPKPRVLVRRLAVTGASGSGPDRGNLTAPDPILRSNPTPCAHPALPPPHEKSPDHPNPNPEER